MNNDPFNTLSNIKTTSNIWWISLLIIIIISIVLSIIFKFKGKKIGKIWVFSAVTIGIMLVLMTISMLFNVNTLYQSF